MERYYFKTRGQEPDVDCVEKCMFKNTGTMIGSANCRVCEHHFENNENEWGDYTWLKCDKIDEATKSVGV